MSDGKTLAEYDRALLESSEVQPVCEHDGHVITVNSRGTFAAKVHEVDVSEDSLDMAMEKVHRAHTNHLKKQKMRVGKACLIYAPGHSWRGNTPTLLTDAFFRGIHAGHGTLQYRLPDGTKGADDNLVLFPPDDSRREEIERLFTEATRLAAEAKVAKYAFQKILSDQQAVMYDGIVEAQSYSFHRDGSYSKPRIRNEPEKALAVTEGIMKNVFGEAAK